MRKSDFDIKKTFFQIILVISFAIIGFVAPKITHAASHFYEKQRNSNTVIVFIHGVLSSRLAWKKGNSYWPKKIYDQKKEFRNSDVFIYEYPTNLRAAPSIDELASDMALTLKSHKVTEYENIVFIAHSMGGIVLRAFLLKNRMIEKKLRQHFFMQLQQLAAVLQI